MKQQHHKTAIVIGAGIVGLASARQLSNQGFQVTVYERNIKAVGASIRNFGMVWPIGQASGEAFQCAIRSRDIWKEIGEKSGLWHEQVGSLHLAYNEKEMAVLEEFVDMYGHERNCSILTPKQTLTKSPAVNSNGLLGALWSNEEVIVDPREAIHQIANYLEEQIGIEFKWNTGVHVIENSTVYYGDNQKQEADVIVVCSGADFETLYPKLYTSLPITKCKLQMMRLEAQPQEWRIGPALCGGLSLLHYDSFLSTPSSGKLREWVESEMDIYLKLGIHVMVSQQGTGELTIGDSHEYGLSLDPFDRQHTNHLIFQYLKQFSRFKNNQLKESWNGVYAKMTDGRSYLFEKPEENVRILNALGGAGMTLSFGLTEKLLNF